MKKKKKKKKSGDGGRGEYTLKYNIIRSNRAGPTGPTGHSTWRGFVSICEYNVIMILRFLS